jgi:hypothetical protein
MYKYEGRTELPNSTAALILGILSIVTCFCYGIIGLPLGIIAVVLGKRAVRLFDSSPESYRGLDNARAGVITGIIGIIFNSLYLVVIILAFLFSISLETLKHIN